MLWVPAKYHPEKPQTDAPDRPSQEDCTPNEATGVGVPEPPAGDPEVQSRPARGWTKPLGSAKGSGVEGLCQPLLRDQPLLKELSVKAEYRAPQRHTMPGEELQCATGSCRRQQEEVGSADAE